MLQIKKSRLTFASSKDKQSLKGQVEGSFPNSSFLDEAREFTPKNSK